MTTFRNDPQRAAACRQLLALHGMERFFALTPTNEACAELEAVRLDTSLLSTGEQVLLRVAFDFWNGSGVATIWAIQSHLDVLAVRAIAELMLASNDPPSRQGRAVDEWLDRWKRFAVWAPSPPPPVE